MAAIQPRPRAIPKLRGKAIHIQCAASDADRAVSFAAGTDRLSPSAAKIRKADRQTTRWRPQPRRRVESLWKKARLYSSREERTPLLRGCSIQRLFVRKRNRQS